MGISRPTLSVTEGIGREILRVVGGAGIGPGWEANAVDRPEVGPKADIDRFQSQEDLPGPTPKLSDGRR